MRRILLITTFIMPTIVGASEHNSGISPYYAKPSGKYFPSRMFTYTRIQPNKSTLSSAENGEAYLRSPRRRHGEKFHDYPPNENRLRTNYSQDEHPSFYSNHKHHESSNKQTTKKLRPKFYENSGKPPKTHNDRKIRLRNVKRKRVDEIEKTFAEKYPNVNLHGQSSLSLRPQQRQDFDFSSSILRGQSEYYEMTELIPTTFASTIATTTIAPLDVNDVRVPIEFLRIEYMISFSFLGVMYGLGFLVLFQNLCVTAAKITVTVVYLALRKVGLLQPYTISQALHQIPPLK